MLKKLLSGIVVLSCAHAFGTNAGATAPKAPKEIDLSELDGIIFNAKNKIKSIEDLIPKLPLNFRTNYVLVTDSYSLQSGTEESPRVLMFGKDTSIVMAFNGGESGATGANTLEVIAYDAATDSSTFSEYIFGPGAKPSTGDKVHKANKYVTAVRNPGVCAGCHGGSDQRMNWDPYPAWPGATPMSFLATAAEKTYLQNFITRGANHKRYQHLKRKENVAAMMDINIETSMASQMDVGIDVQRRTRLIRKLRQTPEFQKYQYSLIGALSACDNMERFFPESIRKKLDATKDRKTLTASVAGNIAVNAPYHSLFLLGVENTRIMGSLRWILENRGIPMYGWSTSLQSSYLFTTVPEVFFPIVVGELSKPLGMDVPDSLRRILLGPSAKLSVLKADDVPRHEAYCKDLAGLSVKQFGP